MLLFDPRTYEASRHDDVTRRALLAVRDFLEAKGHAALKQEGREARWYTDFLEMLARERVFATFGTPAGAGGLIGDGAARWDTARNNDLSSCWHGTRSSTGMHGRSRCSGSAPSG